MTRMAVALLLTLASPGSGFAQDRYQTTATLYAGAHAGGVILPGESNAQRTLTVDTSRKLTMMVTSPSDLQIALESPDGSRVTAGDMGDDRRRWYRFKRENGDDAYVLPGVGRGYNDHITIEAPPPGSYVLHLKRTSSAVGPVPFMITLLQDSDLRMGLVVPSHDALKGAPFLVAGLIFDKDQPIRGANVVATVTRAPDDRISSGVPEGEVALVDAGRGVDTTLGDGIYTGLLAPKSIGRYLVAVRATGVTRAGVPFERHAGLSFEASEPTVRIASVAQSSWHRSNLGTVDKLVIPLAIQGPVGTYEILVSIGASNGRRIAANAVIALSGPGSVRLAVGVEAARVRMLGVDGPYTLESIEVFEIAKQDRILRARRIGVDKTPPVKSSSLEIR